MLERVGTRRRGAASGSISSPAASGSGSRSPAAWCSSPTLLLLDEPLGALDLKLREHMKIELKQLQAAFGTTFVYITHDQSEALVLSDHVAVMNHGRFEQLGTPQELYYEPATAFVAGFVGANNRIFGQAAARRRRDRRDRDRGRLAVRARTSGPIAAGERVEAFVRPEAAMLERDAAELPQTSAHYVGDGARACCSMAPTRRCCCSEERRRFEFRVALPQTGRFADLKVGERVCFGFDPERAICFAAPDAAMPERPRCAAGVAHAGCCSCCCWPRRCCGCSR